MNLIFLHSNPLKWFWESLYLKEERFVPFWIIEQDFDSDNGDIVETTVHKIRMMYWQ